MDAEKDDHTQVRISYFEKEDNGNQNNFSKIRFDQDLNTTST